MNSHSVNWAVIGAGPAGIAAVGKLIDQGVSREEIAWIDPEFKVGDLGKKWSKVSSNTKIDLFIKFFREYKSFEYSTARDQFAIHQEPANNTCILSLAVEPLQWITEKLKNKVHVIIDTVQQLKFYNRQWELSLTHSKLYAKNVILALGSEPKSLAFSGIEEIPLTISLDPDQLAAQCNKEDVIAVFGSSHSAILILKTLLEKSAVKQVINFYQSPLRYAVYFDDWILFDSTGLKGIAAEWAKENIDGRLPSRLQRVQSTQENIRRMLPLCTKAIYATGFKSRNILIEGMQTSEYNDKTGIIAPGLFGLGIAFPEARIDRYGNLEYGVGLWKFMDYLNRIMPLWFSYSA